jgi:uncharacterized protein YjeT (DUF2065 family)
VEFAETALAILGILFAVAGVVVAWVADRFAGLALLLMGAFLLALPFMAYHPDG